MFPERIDTVSVETTMRGLSLLLLVALAAFGERDKFLSRSKRRWVLSTIELEEEMDVKYPFKISTMHNDKTQEIPHSFKIHVDGVDEELFTIDEYSGDVFVHRKIDREKEPFFHIIFDVWDVSKKEKIDKELSFDVEIKDINDNAPRFVKIHRKAYVKENTPPGDYLPVSMEITDDDQEGTINSTVVVTVGSQTPAEPKINVQNVDGKIYQLITNGCFDYDKAKEYKVTIIASDQGKRPLSTTATVTLNIIDTNSHQPQFKKREYQAEAVEMTKFDDILRVAVEDKDTHNTDGWRAKYFFIRGNEDETYKIITDPKTNEGVIGIQKEKNFEITALVELQIGVENDEPIAICKDGKLITDSSKLPLQDYVNITVKMIDTNDAPVFKKTSEDLYQKEESEPGQLLFSPEVSDVDSSNIRFELIEDPANWVTIDTKTGQLTTVKKMDRESPFVDENNIYKIVFAAIDDGDPPATSTCTINVHLADINDNTPTLVKKAVTLCTNRADKIMVSAKDNDQDPYNGPFSFSLVDETASQHWKLDPTYGEEVGIILQKSLPNGNYSVPMVIQDQQNQANEDSLFVRVCECEEDGVCHIPKPLSIGLGSAAIGLILAGILLFLILLAIIVCKPPPMKPMGGEEGNQTLISYNQEGGGTDCMADPTVVTSMTTKGGVVTTDGFKTSYMENTEATPGIICSKEVYNSVNHNITSNISTMESQQWRGRSSMGSSRYGSSSFNKRSTLQRNFNSRRSMSVWSERHLSNLLERRLVMVNEDSTLTEDDCIKNYQYEKEEILNEDVEELPFDNQEEDFSFLDNLSPQFKTLERIILETVKPTTSEA